MRLEQLQHPRHTSIAPVSQVFLFLHLSLPPFPSTCLDFSSDPPSSHTFIRKLQLTRLGVARVSQILLTLSLLSSGSSSSSPPQYLSHSSRRVFVSSPPLLLLFRLDQPQSSNPKLSPPALIDLDSRVPHQQPGLPLFPSTDLQLASETLHLSRPPKPFLSTLPIILFHNLPPDLLRQLYSCFTFYPIPPPRPSPTLLLQLLHLRHLALPPFIPFSKITRSSEC